ncbi:MAG: sulfur carrier protein ThiS [Clostridia bacterium]|nr:sulfur carrier protein ThiS [Clostridia bacterium]
MIIFLNGEKCIVVENTTVLDLLIQKNIDVDTIVVEHNAKILQRENFSQITLCENDVLEVLRFVGGG